MSTVLTPETKRQSEQAVIYPELLEQLSGSDSSADDHDENSLMSEHTAQKSDGATDSSLQQETNSLEDLMKRLYGKPALP